MEGKKIIAKVKGPLVFQPKGDEIIEELNKQWDVEITPSGLCTASKFQCGDNKVTLVLEFNTMDIELCETESGARRTVTIPVFLTEESSD